MITREYLHSILDYSVVTGEFWWKVRKAFGVSIGPAGTYSRARGRVYVRIKIDGKNYLAHVLAHVYVTGRWPLDEIDHANNDGVHNGWHNLRLSTHTQNMGNQGPRKSNTSGFKGVWYSKRRGKFQSAIRVGGERYHLGYFVTAQEAYNAYCTAAGKFFGEFANFG